MPRLFTAIEVPRSVGQMLSMLRGGLPGARWIDEENYHITLCFIGDIDDGLARDVADGLFQVRRAPFEITIEGLDAFGGSKPKSVYAGVRSTHLVDLQAAQEKLLRRLGAPLDTREFRPHVTLARLRGEATPRMTADWLAMRGGFLKHVLPVSRFVLFSSRDSVGGGPYLVEEAYPLW